MFWLTCVLFFGVHDFVSSEGPCKLSENGCLEKLNKEIFSAITYQKIVSGDPAVGAENLDPLHHDTVEGNLSVLKYKIDNSDTVGFKDCQAQSEKIKLNAEGVPTFHVDIICPKFVMNGKYELGGRLIILPVEGNGDFFMETNKYNISVDAELKIAPGKDGKHYMTVKNFKQAAEPLGKIIFDFKNLFNGQKDLADAVLKFANENWYEVAKEVQDPIFNAHIKKLISNVNKYLKKLPLDNLVVL